MFCAIKLGVVSGYRKWKAVNVKHPNTQEQLKTFRKIHPHNYTNRRTYFFSMCMRLFSFEFLHYAKTWCCVRLATAGQQQHQYIYKQRKLWLSGGWVLFEHEWCSGITSKPELSSCKCIYLCTILLFALFILKFSCEFWLNCVTNFFW